MAPQNKHYQQVNLISNNEKKNIMGETNSKSTTNHKNNLKVKKHMSKMDMLKSSGSSQVALENWGYPGYLTMEQYMIFVSIYAFHHIFYMILLYLFFF